MFRKFFRLVYFYFFLHYSKWMENYECSKDQTFWILLKFEVAWSIFRIKVVPFFFDIVLLQKCVEKYICQMKIYHPNIIENSVKPNIGDWQCYWIWKDGCSQNEVTNLQSPSKDIDIVQLSVNIRGVKMPLNCPNCPYF